MPSLYSPHLRTTSNPPWAFAGLTHSLAILNLVGCDVVADPPMAQRYRTKNPISKRLARFRYDVEHYELKLIYRTGHLQRVPDSLSQMPGLNEEGDPADTNRLFQTNLSEAKKICDSIEVITPQMINFYQQLRTYLQSKSEKSEVYKLKAGKIWLASLKCKLHTYLMISIRLYRLFTRLLVIIINL